MFPFSRWSSCIFPTSSCPMQSSIAGQLTSLQYSSEEITSFKLSTEEDFSLVINYVCAQVPDAVPGRCVGVSILPVLCEDQETVGTLFATGEKKIACMFW